MPNQQFIQHLRDEREVHSSVISSIDRLLTFYGEPANVTEKTGGAHKAGKSSIGKRQKLNDADKTRVQDMLRQGKSNLEIISALGGRVVIEQVYTIKADMKKKGMLPD